MAEELVLQQVVGDRRAVDRQEHLAGCRSDGMQRAGDQLLAGARFTGDQHGAPRGSNLADQGLDRLHRRALADQGLDVDLAVELATEGLVLE